MIHEIKSLKKLISILMDDFKDFKGLEKVKISEATKKL